MERDVTVVAAMSANQSGFLRCDRCRPSAPINAFHGEMSSVTRHHLPKRGIRGRSPSKDLHPHVRACE